MSDNLTNISNTTLVLIEPLVSLNHCELKSSSDLIACILGPQFRLRIVGRGVLTDQDQGSSEMVLCNGLASEHAETIQYDAYE